MEGDNSQVNVKLNQDAIELDSNQDKNDPVSKPEVTKKSKTVKRRKKKVEIACVYCRRSHMICDDSRPCQRCIKRGISNLCHDEPSNSRQRKKAASMVKGSDLQLSSPVIQPAIPQQSLIPNIQPKDQRTAIPNSSSNSQPLKSINKSVLSQTLPYNQEPFFYSEHAGSEFSSLNDFLSMIDDPDLVHGTLNDDSNNNERLYTFGMGATNGNNISNVDMSNDSNNNNINNLTNILSFSPNANLFTEPFPNEQETVQQQEQQTHRQQQQYLQKQRQQIQNQDQPQTQQQTQSQNQGQSNTNSSYTKLVSQASIPVSHATSQPAISEAARDKFFLTAADPTTEISPEERLKQVIKAKLEAGLLQPYNYAKGYARLQSYMDNYMNISSRQRILKPLSIFRPAFRAIARTLKDVDLVLVEESFERMLLDYDRVFTSMAIPACLWRRTGEIYRGNKEFASLVGVVTDDLKDGKLAIYELMSEESAVNFWEKYGAIAFDKGQKAVLTSCNLRTKDGIKRKSCCFSFTIRRDRYNIPSCIVGNFIPIDP